MANDISTRGQIVSALALLTKRRAATKDAAEKAAINEAIDALNGNIQDLDQAELQQATQILAAAATELEKVVAAAKLGPFDSYVSDVERVIHALRGSPGAPQSAAIAGPVSIPDRKNAPSPPGTHAAAAKPKHNT